MTDPIPIPIPQAPQAPQAPLVHLDEISTCVHHESERSESIPQKLKTWYSHTSYRAIILSFLSIFSIFMAFIGLFTGKISGCECMGFISSVIALFAPSPLQHR